MTTRRHFLLRTIGAMVLASPLRAFAQSQGKVVRIGVLSAQSQSESSLLYEPFFQGMHELGYVQGRNLIVEERYADGQQRRLQEHAAELVRLKVDVIVVSSTPTGQAAQQATRTIPIVIMATADPVGDGFAKSLARPGGNITGMSTGAAMTVTKHLELLMAAMPGLSRLAVLVNPANRAHPPQLGEIRSAGKKYGLRVMAFEAGTPEMIEGAFRKMRQERADAVILLRESMFNRRGRHIAELAMKHKLPSITAFEGYAEDGGLMSYGDNTPERHRRAATQVDKILKGANPAELPFEQPTKFYLAINRKTAQALGLAIPQELLLRAEKVIE